MINLFTKIILNTPGFILGFLIFSSTLFASKWTGDVDTDWNNPANWFHGNIHVNGESFSFGPSPTYYPIITSGNIIINSLNLSPNTITQNGGTITVDNLNIQGSGTFNQNGGLLVINNNYDNSGGIFYSLGGTIQFSGTGGATVNFGGSNQFSNVIIDSGSDPQFDESASNIINISGDFTNNNSNLANSQGTVIFNGTGTQTIYSASTNNTFYDLEINQTNGDISFTSDVTIANNFSNTSGSTTNDNGYNVTATSGDPLPVELTIFTALVNDNYITLNWETATEVNNYGFEIERLKSEANSQNIEWRKIDFVEGRGNSNSPKYYTYTDKSVETSGKYSYRLKQIDIDGLFEYSDVVEVNIEAPNSYELSQNYPNPFNPTTSISYAIPKDGFVTLSIYDILGNEVIKLEDGNRNAGSYEVTFDATNLTSGFYFYTLKANNFVQSKKMLLMK